MGKENLTEFVTKFIGTGAYESADALVDKVKDNIDKGKWFNVSFNFIMLEDNSTIIDAINIVEIEE